MGPETRDILVVGGGISGLTCAHHLKRSGADVCLLEANTTAGGCTRTREQDGFLLEQGPFNIMVRDPDFEALLVELGDAVRVVRASDAARVRFIYKHGALHAVPSNPVALGTTKLLSARARIRLVRGLILSRRAGHGEETIEQAASRRFGMEVTDTMISAVIAGIFSGDISRLSLPACFPAPGEVDATYRSLFGYGLRKAFGRNGAKRRWRGLVSLDGGLGALTGAMGERLGSDLRTGCSASEVRRANGGFEVKAQDGHGPTETIRSRRLVIATPAPQTSALLQPLLPEASDVVRSLESTSLVVLNLGFRSSDVGHPMQGFGFLVPRTESAFPLMGVLWADSIFPHYAPPGHRLLRVFIGGARDPKAIGLSDGELRSRALTALKDLLELRGDPVLFDVCRYPSAIPQYYRGHREKIAHLRKCIAGVPGLHLVGNYLEGVSVNDCVRLGTRVGHEIMGAAPPVVATPRHEQLAGSISVA